jgi:hypothetical protein
MLCTIFHIHVLVSIFILQVKNSSIFEFILWSLNSSISSAWVTSLNNQDILSTHQSESYVLTTKDLDQSDRVGSFALLLNSSVAVVIGILFPWIVSKCWISMKLVFTFSIAALAITLFCTFFVHQVISAYVILAILGIPLACAHWIPFSLIGQYLEIEKSEHHHRDSIVAANTTVDQIITTTEKPQQQQQKKQLLETGMVVGVHNIYVVVPQFIVAFISSLIFNAVHDKEQNDTKARVVGIVWVLQFGGLMAILATVLSRWIDRV